MRKGRLNSMVVSFQSPTPRTGKEGCFKRLGLCPEEALEELQSFTLHKTSPRKGSTRPCGKAVAGMGWSGPALYTGRPDPAVPVPNPSCRQRGLSLGDKGASGQAATATFLQSCSFNNIGYEKLQNGYQIFICFFFFFFFDGATQRHKEHERCAPRSVLLKNPYLKTIPQWVRLSSTRQGLSV